MCLFLYIGVLQQQPYLIFTFSEMGLLSSALGKADHVCHSFYFACIL